MKIFLIFDTAGAIVSTARSEAPGQAVLAGAGEGEEVVELDASEVRMPGAHAGRAPEFFALADHIAKHHRVVGGKLVERDK
jgi:hypothetical protein